tara:strand:- start:79 stop:276 length:198 start_codon:yes stop_codon:yes gene_type:complete
MILHLNYLENKKMINKQNELYPLFEYFFGNKPLNKCSKECQRQVKQLRDDEKKYIKDHFQLIHIK